MPNHPTLEHRQRREIDETEREPIAVEIGRDPANQEWGHSLDEFVMKERNRTKDTAAILRKTSGNEYGTSPNVKKESVAL